MADEISNDGEGEGLPKSVIGAIIVVIVIIAVVIVATGKSKFEPVDVGTEAIEFELPDLDGKLVKLSDYRGKVVFLNFWAMWCKPCEAEMPSMQELYESMPKEKFVVVAVSVDNKASDIVQQWIDKRNLTFEILHDKRGKIKERYKTTGVPETFIIDQNGIVAERVIGERNWSSESNIYTILDLISNGAQSPEYYKERGNKRKADKIKMLKEMSK
jgi:peroxiredoxin